MSSGIVFVIQTLFQAYLILLLLYVLLRASGAHFANPIIQSLIRVSEPLIKPARKVIGENGKVDWAAWLVILLLQLIELILLMAFTNLSPNLVGMLLYSLVKVAKLVVNIYFFALIIFAIMSWVQAASSSTNPLNHVLYHLTLPILRPIKNILPDMGGIDFSPLLAIIILQLINMMVLSPLLNTAIGML